MTEDQRKELAGCFTLYATNNGLKGKKAAETERAMLAGAIATLITLGQRDAYLEMLALSGRRLTEELAK